MARKGRGSDLAGLAALGALGYMLSKGSKAAPTGGGSSAVSSAAAEEAPLITDDMRRRAKEEGEKISEGERISSMSASKPADKPADKPNVASSAAAVKPASTAKPSAATGLKNPGTGNQRGPTAEELAAYNASRRKNPGTGNQRGPTAEELEAYAASRRRPTAVNTGSVRDIPTGGPAGYSGVRGEKIDSSELGRNVSNTLAAMGPGKLSGVSKIGYEMRNADAIRKAALAGEVPSRGREAVTNPMMWMGGPKNVGKFAEDVPSAGREAVTNPMAWMAGPKGMAQMDEAAPSMTTRAKEAAEAAAARFRKKPLSEADTTGGAGRYGYKKGGAVKKKMASGGMTGSASKRADGIASKGKTRGKIC